MTRSVVSSGRRGVRKWFGLFAGIAVAMTLGLPGVFVAAATSGATGTEILRAIGLFGGSNLGDGLTLNVGMHRCSRTARRRHSAP